MIASIRSSGLPYPIHLVFVVGNGRGNGTTTIEHRLLSSNVIVGGFQAQLQMKVDKFLPKVTATWTPTSGAGASNPVGPHNLIQRLGLVAGERQRPTQADHRRAATGAHV